jgi:hypothetical protein
MENNNKVCTCLRCGDPIENPEAGRARELCFGCKYDLICFNNERVQEYNNEPARNYDPKITYSAR